MQALLIRSFHSSKNLRY